MTDKVIERLDWYSLPSWAKEGGEHFDGYWVPDCGGKTDFDPGLLRLSCRVYPDGKYICSVILGADEELKTTGILQAPTKTAAKAAVEAWCSEIAGFYLDVIREATGGAS